MADIWNFFYFKIFLVFFLQNLSNFCRFVADFFFGFFYLPFIIVYKNILCFIIYFKIYVKNFFLKIIFRNKFLFRLFTISLKFKRTIAFFHILYLFFWCCYFISLFFICSFVAIYLVIHFVFPVLDSIFLANVTSLLFYDYRIGAYTPFVAVISTPITILLYGIFAPSHHDVFFSFYDEETEEPDDDIEDFDEGKELNTYKDAAMEEAREHFWYPHWYEGPPDWAVEEIETIDEDNESGEEDGSDSNFWDLVAISFCIGAFETFSWWQVYLTDWPKPLLWPTGVFYHAWLSRGILSTIWDYFSFLYYNTVSYVYIYIHMPADVSCSYGYGLFGFFFFPSVFRSWGKLVFEVSMTCDYFWFFFPFI